MRSFVGGIITACMGGVVSLVLQDIWLAVKIPGIIGVVSLFITGISSGFFSDSIYRFAVSESKEEFRKRLDWEGKVFWFALPNIIVAGIMLVLIGKY